MLYSLLTDEKICYISMHAECALHTEPSEFIPEDKLSEARKRQGFYCNRINGSILQGIYSHKYDDRDLCLDFSRIDEFYEKNAAGFYTYIYESFYAKNKCVYFLNVKKKLRVQMDFLDNVIDIYEDKESVSFCYGNLMTPRSYEELIFGQKQLFNIKFEKLVIESTDSCTRELHRSVPVYLNKYINLKKMVDKDARMLRYAIYVLANNLVNNKILSDDCYSNRNVSFFFQTLNGSFVATQLAELFSMNMFFLDHLGPIKSIHRKSFEKYICDNSKYIIVSDVICLGGEVGRARTIIEYFGGQVLSEICLVDIKTVQSYSEGNRISLYTVSDRCNKIDYLIKTDLCTRCRKA